MKYLGYTGDSVTLSSAPNLPPWARCLDTQPHSIIPPSPHPTPREVAVLRYPTVEKHEPPLGGKIPLWAHKERKNCF